MNQSSARTFPRYPVEKRKLVIITEDGQKVQVRNLSLGGIGLYSQVKIDSNKNLTGTLQLGKQFFKLNLQPVWQKEIKTNDGQILYHSGWALTFDQEEHFRPWPLLMQALEKMDMRGAKT